MNRIYPTHRVAPCVAPRVAPLKRQDAWRLLLAVLVSFGAATACTSGDSGGADGDTAAGTRLTTIGAGELLSQGFNTPQPGSRGLAMIGRAAPTGPTPEQMSIDSLGVDFGTSEAPLRMIEFYDYGCGYCRAFHQDTRGLLLEQYAESGQVLWKSIPFIIGRWAASVPVSLAAECARDQGRGYFEAISTLIFRHQSDWKSASAPEELAEGYAEQAGLDMERYRTCFGSEELLWRVQVQTKVAQDAGVRGTPTFFIVGFGPITGALPFETFQQVIDTVLVRVAAAQP